MKTISITPVWKTKQTTTTTFIRFSQNCTEDTYDVTREGRRSDVPITPTPSSPTPPPFPKSEYSGNVLTIQSGGFADPFSPNRAQPTLRWPLERRRGGELSRSIIPLGTVSNVIAGRVNVDRSMHRPKEVTTPWPQECFLIRLFEV